MGGFASRLAKQRRRSGLYVAVEQKFPGIVGTRIVRLAAVLPQSLGTRLSEDIRLVPVGFASLILLGALLLALPVACTEGRHLGYLDAMFLATSAVCVTGLSTVDVSSTLSPFGQAVLLALVQVGGLGFVTAGTLLALVRRGGLTLSHERSIHATVGRLRNARPLDIFVYACVSVVIVELAGTVALFDRIAAAEPDWALSQVLWEAAFHSVSSFCNAGLSITPQGVAHWREHPDILAVLTTLVILGGIGLLSLVNLRYLAFWRRDPRRRGYLTLQTKISVASAAFLVVIGAVFTMIFESQHSQAGVGWGERLTWSVFHSAMTRTAGFNVVDVSEMHPATLLFSMVLMFIGGAPGSMAGGIKTVTFVLLLLSARAAITRREDIQVFRRRIAPGLVGTAVMIALLAMAAIVMGILLLMLTEEGHPAAETRHRWLAVAFEAVSAFGTVGLSTGITPLLTSAGKLVVVMLMYAGRVGPLVLALYLSRPVSPWRIRPPLEDLALG